MSLFKLWNLIWNKEANLGKVIIDNARVADMIRLGRQ